MTNQISILLDLFGLETLKESSNRDFHSNFRLSSADVKLWS